MAEPEEEKNPPAPKPEVPPDLPEIAAKDPAAGPDPKAPPDKNAPPDPKKRTPGWKPAP